MAVDKNNNAVEEDAVNWTRNEKRMLKHLLLNDNLAYSRYFFKHREAMKMLISPHHLIMADTLRKVFTGEIKRLIINVPPGYTKTEMAVILFMSQGLAINPKAKFIHATYSGDLALENSQKTKDIVISPEFHDLFGLNVRQDSKSKKKWYTEEGGGVYAVAAGGAITGFRAGRFQLGFQGAFIFDDPIKPDDAYSPTKRAKINNRFMNTFKSRLALEKETPMILIMQRIHEDDPSGYLLTGGTGEKWHHLLLPTPMPPGPVSKWYPKEYTHGIPIEYDLEPGPLWPFKHDAEKLVEMERTDPYTTSSQYGQRPTPKGGTIFKDEWWKYWTVLPKDLAYMRIYADTAQKKEEHNDYTVLQAWAYSPSMGIILIEQFRGKLEAPELEKTFVEFWNKMTDWCKAQGIRCTVVKVEDKSSGSSLIQTIKKKTLVPIKGIQRSKDKITRAYGVVPQITTGNVWLPQNAVWIFDFKDECRKFSPLMAHKHDDQIDPLMDAVEDMLMNKNVVPVGGESHTQTDDTPGTDYGYYG
ncbi:MAG: phage terminase large subunit [Alteromonadaceae bacterium]|nr:phage terminase large subunit [Alteromonadaceae bacterium]